jgi:hypothetical protein
VEQPPQPPPASAPPPGWSGTAPLPPSAPGVTPPSPPPSGPTRTGRPFLILGAATVVVLAAFALFTVLTGDDDGGPGPFSPVAEAAQKTGDLPGARVSGTGTVTGNGMTMNMQLTGAFNAEENRSTMQMDMQSSVALPPGMEITPMTAIQDGATMYLTAPMFAGQLPDGKSWMKLDLSEVVDESLLEQQNSMDARSALAQLESADAVTEVGTERVRGVKTTRYTASVDSATQAEAARAAGQDLQAEILEQNPGVSTSDVWVDNKGYVRRVATLVPFAAVGGPGAEMSMTMDFFDFGATAAIEPPPEDQTFDATEMAIEGMEAQLGV